MRKLTPPKTFSQADTPLVVKGSLPRVFLGLGVFMEAGLLFCGSYLLTDAILQPLDAGTFSVVGGGLFLGLATVLLFYLAWPLKRKFSWRRQKSEQLTLEITLKPCREEGQSLRQSGWAGEQKGRFIGPM
ncbi:MAG TPA: hypothetical protein VFI38_02905 [Candidatus Acidoferrum sp.]|nr:hypothetical protein [Candidatus Acidoferrum sp.]